jgi:hypothetical protein
MLEAKNAGLLSDFHAFASLSFLRIAENYYKQTHIIKGSFHDDLGGVITALRLSFENHQYTKLSQSDDFLTLDSTDAYFKDAYDKIRQLDSVVYFDSTDFFDVVKSLADKASVLSGVGVSVKAFGFGGKINAGSSYTAYFYIQKLLFDVVRQYKKGELVINISGKKDCLSLIIVTKGFTLSKDMFMQLGASLDNKVYIEDVDSKQRGSKFIITIPYI